MAAKDIVFSDNARSKLIEGVNILANAVPFAGWPELLVMPWAEPD
jgi:hypothetical protein